jgi:hypothetical protein
MWAYACMRTSDIGREEIASERVAGGAGDSGELGSFEKLSFVILPEGRLIRSWSLDALV